MTERTPRFPKPKPGAGWPPAVKALVIVEAEASDDFDTFLARLTAAARWPDGLPAARTLRRWLTDAGIVLAAGHPSRFGSTPDRAKVAREARLDRLAERRETISDALATQAVPLAIEALVAILEEQRSVKARIDDARDRLDEALVMQRAVMDGDDDGKKAARREVTYARLMLALEREDRLAVVDAVRVITHGLQRHLELEGIAEGRDADEDTNPLIVEIHVPEARPQAAMVVPQHQLPERT